jgi:hypothetical protein
VWLTYEAAYFWIVLSYKPENIDNRGASTTELTTWPQ